MMQNSLLAMRNVGMYRMFILLILFLCFSSLTSAKTENQASYRLYKCQNRRLSYATFYIQVPYESLF